MGLLDAIFGDSGGGLLGGLPREWQYQNPPSQGFGGPIFAGQPQQPLTPTEQALMGLVQPGAPAGYQPGIPGAAPAPAPAPVQPSAPAPQASPMQIGGYQMPRMGNPDLYQPQQVETPPAAQPAQGRMQAPPAVQAAFMSPPTQSGFGGAARGALANLQNGPLGLIAGALAGGLGMGQGSPQDIARQNQQAQYQAFIGAGLSPQNAMLAVLNPEAGKTLINEALTNKQEYGVISDDPLAGKKYGFINKYDQTINGRPIGSQDATSQMMGLDGLQRAQQAGVTGDQLYEYLPKSMAPVVKAMIEGRQPLPSTTAMRSPATLALIDAAHSIDPNFDATVWKSRNEAGPDWTKGKSSEMVRSANQTLAHVGSLMDAMDDLKNTRYPIVNAIGNTVSEQMGAGEQGSFRTNAHAVAEEMSKVFKGANLSDSEIRHWEQNLSENMSPAQQRAQIAKLSELLHGSLEALQEKRLTAMGPAMAAKQGPLIKEKGQQVLERIDKWLKAEPGETAPKAAAPAALPAGWDYKGSR